MLVGERSASNSRSATGKPISTALSRSGSSVTGARIPTTLNQRSPSHTLTPGRLMPSRLAAVAPSTTAGWSSWPSVRAHRRADRKPRPRREDQRRLVSVADPDARPIRKGKLGKPTEFGYVAPLCELTDSTRPGQRGLILPPAAAPGNPGENTLLPDTVAELKALGLRPGEVALDGGFGDQRSAQQLADVQPERLFVAGR